MRALVVILLTALLSSGPAVTRSLAQPEPNGLGIFGDEGGAQSVLFIQAFLPFDAWIVALNPTGGIRGYEFGIDVPASLTVLDREILGSELRITTDDPNDFIVGLSGACLDAPANPLVRVNLGYFQGPAAPADMTICLRATDPSSIPGVPSYLGCDGEVRPFEEASTGSGVYPDGCLILNPTEPTGLVWYWDLTLPDGHNEPGQIATVPLTVDERVESVPLAGKRTTYTPPYATNLGFDIVFDPAVAEWQSATVGAGTADWSIDAVEVEPGRWHVDLVAPADPDPDDFLCPGFGAPEDQEIVLLSLRVLADDAITSITTENESMADTCFQAPPANFTSALGRIGPTIIAVEQPTLGALKARYVSRED